MDKIKTRKKSLKRDFMKYFALCVIFVFLGGCLIAVLLQTELAAKYGEAAGNNADRRSIYHEVSVLHIAAIALWPITCVVGGTVFYKRKLEKPIKILLEASEKIANNQLDFTVEIPEQNELGQLCESFEKMRAALQANCLEMWRQVEERKRLNAAFAHDLRTPLTVLKGQSEMLAKYSPNMTKDKIVATAETMRKHIARLENYVSTMNILQRLEDTDIQKKPISLMEIVTQLQETGASVCQSKEFIFRNDIVAITEMSLDFSAVQRVYENLLTNAFRYAHHRVTVSINAEGKAFSLTVSDDGAGFSEKDLSHALKPFYTSASNAETEHFGMGLNICKILCEKHGGSLTLSNREGAQVVATFIQ